MVPQHRIAAYSVLFLIKDDQVLLLQRANTGFADDLYTLPGGKVEAGETFRHSLVREAAEELGIIIRPEDLRFAHVFQKKGTEYEFVALVFKAVSWRGEPVNKEPHKASSVAWFKLDALPEPECMLNTHRDIIECIKKGVEYSEHEW